MIFSELQLKIQNAKALDFGTIFNQSIELFKKVWVQGLVMLLLTIALMLPFYLLMYLPLIALGVLEPEILQGGQTLELTFLIPFYLFMIVISFIGVVIAFGLKAAFYRICKAKDFNEATSDDYFYFFKKPYFGKTIRLAAITFGISILATLLCFFPVIYVMVPLTLVNVIYAFNPELSAANIIKAGFELGNKKWLLTFGLLIVAGLLAKMVGVLLCVIGVFVTVSFSYLPPYFIYKDSLGLGGDNI